MLKAIVFDFDGVLVDSEPLHYRAFLQIAQQLGQSFTYEQYLEDLVGFDDRDAFAWLLARDPKTADEAGNPQRIAELCQAKGDAFVEICQQGIEPIPHMLDFVDHVTKLELPMAICSGATRKDIDLILVGLGLTDRFCPIVTADDVTRSKPDPESYRKAAQQLADLYPQLELKPENCLAIEDTIAGLRSARGAGLWTLALTTTYRADELHEAHRVVESMQGVTWDQLKAWLGGGDG